MAIVRPLDGRRLTLALFFSGIVKHDESDAVNLALCRAVHNRVFLSCGTKDSPFAQLRYQARNGQKGALRKSGDHPAANRSLEGRKFPGPEGPC